MVGFAIRGDSFEAVNSDERLTSPFVRDPDNQRQLLGTDWGSALASSAEAIRRAGPQKVGIIAVSYTHLTLPTICSV